LAKEQIAEAGYKDAGSENSIQIYTEAGGASVSDAQSAVKYINSALTKGIPIIVGVDAFKGRIKENNDASTDHFIVIVGSGTDNKGNFYRFYDNSTSNVRDGTSNANKLYYNNATGIISGNTQSAYDNVDAQENDSTRHPYIVTQVRKVYQIDHEEPDSYICLCCFGCRCYGESGSDR
jgi:hypothetical protein